MERGDGMTMDLYNIFKCVVEEGSISKASKVLFVSQPAVSKAIKNLETALGVQLFERLPRGVAMTAEGEVLYNHVQLAFRQLHEGEKRIRQLKEREFGSIRIGVSATLCQYYFMPYLNTFHQQYPQLKIEIVNRRSLETVKLMEEGLLDCAVISHMPFPTGYKYVPLMDIQDIFVGKTPPPKPILDLVDLERYPMLLLEKRNGTRDYLDQFLRSNNVKLNVDIEISNMAFLIEFAKIGLGLASVIGDFIPEVLASKELYEWPVNPSIPKRSIGLLFKEVDRGSLACETFIDYMLETN